MIGNKKMNTSMYTLYQVKPTRNVKSNYMAKRKKIKPEFVDNKTEEGYSNFDAMTNQNKSFHS